MKKGVDKTLRFQGTLGTDDVGILIIKQNTDTSRKFFTARIKAVVDDQEQYIEGLNQADLNCTENKCVLIDPERRYLLYCMKETSTFEEKQTLIFTKNNRTNAQDISDFYEIKTNFWWSKKPKQRSPKQNLNL